MNLVEDAVEGLIKKIGLSEYTEDGKKSREDSPRKKQSPKKNFKVMVGGKGKETGNEDEEKY